MILEVTRADDPRIASYARVGDPAWLLANGLFVAEGRLVVRRLLELARYEVDSVLATPPALAALSDVLPPSCLVYTGTQPVLDAITGFHFHRGCLALVRRPENARLVATSATRRLVALEGVGNPDNVGGIFRVAAAFGVEGVLLDPTSADPLYRKAIRTSMGAALQVPFARSEHWPGDLVRIKEAGLSVMALTPDRAAPPLDAIAARMPERWVLLAGAEGPGLSEAALSASDIQVRIPTTTAVDSLNVTVALGIALSRLAEAEDHGR